MLRITLPDCGGHGVFVLEGRLTGLWTRELLRVAREANKGYGNTFDLREVVYVDSAGEETLRALNRCEARFITESAYGKDLCRRLKLHRVAASEANGQRPIGSLGPGSSRPALARNPEAFSSAAGQCLQECGE